MTNTQTQDSIDLLTKHIGDIFTIIEPVHDLWKSKRNILYIQLKRYKTGSIEKLKQFNFIENAQEAGGNNVLKITLKKTN